MQRKHLRSRGKRSRNLKTAKALGLRIPQTVRRPDRELDQMVVSPRVEVGAAEPEETVATP